MYVPGSKNRLAIDQSLDKVLCSMWEARVDWKFSQVWIKDCVPFSRKQE
jgi:hypothetical protein